MTDDLQAHELVPVGGTWGGLLFENANVATGIIVHANVGVADIERDKQSLSRFTDASPLVGTPRSAGSLFLPATGSGQ